MKIGILTFHWGVNHGAILQTYATTKYLINKNCDVEVIDYVPKEREIKFLKIFKPHYPSVMLERAEQWFKEQKLIGFRKKLPLSKRYFSNQELIDNPPEVDILLCGSDQIWNPTFAMNGENKVTPVYFLNFGKSGCKKAALSVSFGCEKYPKNVELIAENYIKQLDCISVRENTGVSILKNLGVENVFLTADPTSLLSTDEYLVICKDVKENKNKNIALCILRKQNKQTRELIKDVCCLLKIKKINDIKNKSMQSWLAGIRDANVVVTNSFHCVMMCLKLHIPFYVILEANTLSGMNDRMYTLLERVGLTNRIVKDVSELNNSIQINWNYVDFKMEEYAKTLVDYLDVLITDKEIPKDFKINTRETGNRVNCIKAYAAKASDAIRLQSSSGGIFTLFAESVLDSKGVVYGAAFSEDFKTVKHIEISSKQDLYKLRGSKYIQSDLREIYSKVYSRLQEGKLVYFTGTPCQIASLKSFLKIDYDNLICQDIICHGTPLSKVWTKYAECLEKKQKSKLSAVSFRDKKAGWRDYNIRYIFENGKQISKLASTDLYMRGFLSNLFLKESCYNCSFKGNNNFADITLGDYWGIEKIHPDFSDNVGVSLVIVRTEKGQNLLSKQIDKMQFIDTNLEKALVYNTSMLCSAKKNINTDDFLSNINNINIDFLLRKFCDIGLKFYLIRFLKKLISKLSK